MPSAVAENERSGIVERVIERVAPQWAVNRTVARLQLKNIRRYDAASKSSRLKGWNTPSTSPDGITRATKEVMRNRTRDLERNNAWYRRAIDLLVNNVIGSGIRLQILTDEKSNDRRDQLQKWINDKINSLNLDYDGLNDFYGLCRLIYRTGLVAGECLIVKHVSKKNGLQIQVLEPDFLDDTKDGVRTPSGGYISQGIEFNSQGQRVAYWLFENHPNDYILKNTYKSVRVPADRVIHYYRPERPGQIRGVPKGTQIIVRLHDLDLFQDAELKKNQISSLLVGFRTKAASKTGPADIKRKRGINLYPGTVEELEPGEGMEWSNPPQHQMYPEYVRTILMEIAAAFGHTYQQLSGDLKRTNFSSGRMGWIESSRFYNAEQKDFISGVLNPVFYWILEIEGLLNGIRTNDAKAKWFTPHREMIDPPKEIKAFADAKNENILPLSYIWQSLGYDEDEVISAISDINEKMKKAGIPLSKSKTEKEEDNAEDKD